MINLDNYVGGARVAPEDQVSWLERSASIIQEQLQEVVMKRIPLSMGLFAIVDDEDYCRISAWKWHAHKHPNSKTPYAMRNVTGGVKPMHYEVLRIESKRGMHLHHKDGNGLNNIKTNLEHISISRHRQLDIGKKKNSKCYVGIRKYIDPRNRTKKTSYKYQAYFSGGGKWKSLGYYDSQVDAAMAYDVAAREMYGDDCYQNFPQVK